MPRAAVRILHPEPGDRAGELTSLLARARSLAADDLARRLGAAGADDVRIDRGTPDGVPFGARLRGLASELQPGMGLVVLGSGSIPLAVEEDLRALVEAAGSGERRALTNNRYSSDVVAIGDAAILASVPDLPSDNGLPRWLAGQGVPVDQTRDGRRLGLDIDSPLDLELLRMEPRCPTPLVELASTISHLLARARETLEGLAALGVDPTRELLVAGRLSGATLIELEERTRCRVRALVEERGLRTAMRGQRPPASALGLLLDRDGPGAIGALVERLSDGAVIDTRVLLAHRLGPDESGWPEPEDRYASDLLLPDRVGDPWLRELTLHASSYRLPIALGGHTLVGPALPLALGLDR